MTTGADTDWQFENESTNTLSSLEDDEDEESVWSWKLGLQVTSLLVICVLSVVGNFLVFFSLLKKEQLRIPSNRLVFSLTVSNFILSILVYPFIVVSCVFGDWMFGIFWCNFTAFLTVLVTSASALNIGVIAIDRYYAIVRPLLYTITITNSRSTLLLLTVWLLAFSCALPPLFGWSKFRYQSIEGACFVDWSDRISYTAFVLCTSVLLPFVTMVVCYYFIFQVVRTKCRKIHVGTVGPDGDAGSSLESPQRRVVRHSSSWRFSLPRKPSWLLAYSSPVKGLRTICFVLGVFMMTTFPFLVTSLAQASEMSEWFPWWFNVFSLWLLFTSSATYPIVYGLFNRSIRKHLKFCVFPFSFCNWRSSSGVGRPSSRRVSVSISLLDFSPFKPFRTLNNSRRSSTVSFDGNRIIFACNSRKGSQDSGAVMTESDGELESIHFASHRNRRRLSAPSRLQVMSTIFGQSNYNSVTNALKMTRTLNPDSTEARSSLVNLATRRNLFCRQLERAAQKRTRSSVAVIDIPSDYATASTSLATSTSPAEDLLDVSVDEGIDNDIQSRNQVQL